MRSLLGCLLVLSVAGLANGADRKDELFAGWEKAQRRVESLVVEFTLETKNPNFGTSEKASGTFRLIRTKTGEVFASYEGIAEKGKGEKPGRFIGLLSKGAIYILNDDKKIAIRFDPAEGKLSQFLEDHFNPFVRLLDRKRVEEECHLSVFKQDKWYTYLDLKGKPGFWGNPLVGRIVLANDDGKAIPKGMPRQIWYADVSGCESTFDIKAWRMNGDKPPKLEEFTRPEDRPGWTVTRFPFRAEK